MGPEKQSKQNISIRGKLTQAASIAALTFATFTSSGCVAPTVSPNPTNPNKPTSTEFVPSATYTATIEPTATNTPTPTEIPLPESLANILPGYSINQGHLTDASGVSLGDVVKDQADGSTDLSFTTTDFNDQVQEHSINLSTVSVRPSGAIIIDSDKRTGFVWKGDRWAEILLQIKFETDGTKFNEFPTINYEDIASGALAEAERLEVQPLPDKVLPFTSYYINIENNYLLNPQQTNEQRAAFFNDGETKPMRFEFFYDIVLNNEPFTLVTLQIKSLDGSFGLLHVVTASKDYINSNPNNLEKWYKKINLQYKPLFILAIFDDPNVSCNQMEDQYLQRTICPLNQPNSKILVPLAQEMSTTGIIPEKFEKIIFQLGIMPW